MTITVTTVELPAISPTLAVTCTSSPSINAPLTIVRVHPDGSEHKLITTDTPRLAAGVWSGIDRHAPFNQVVTYRAAADVQTGVSAPDMVTSSVVWLIASEDPTLSVQVEKWIGPMPSRSRKSRAERMDILDSDEPIHRSDSPMSAPNSQMTVKCRSVESFERLDKLLSLDRPILLNTPYSGFFTRWRWLQVMDVEYSDPVGHIFADFMYATITWEGTSQPDIDAFSPWTLGALKAEYPGETLGVFKTRYATLRELKLDIRA